MSRLICINILTIRLIFHCQARADWQKKDLTEREKINLSVVSNMYGYARHFYPKPQNDKVDWTKFLTYAIEKTETAENDDALLQVLDELFKPLVPDLLFKKDSLPVDFRRKKESGGFYVRSHYTADKPRIRDFKKGMGNGTIQHFDVYEKHMPVPDSMYCYLLNILRKY